MRTTTPLSRQPLPAVTTSDLSRRPGEVLARVGRGERLVVCRHRTPVATLQPLDGFVFQPFAGTAQDVFGWRFGEAEDQVRALSEAERRLLLDGYYRWRVRPCRAALDGELAVMNEALDRMKLKGLVRKTECGTELTGRGLALRETLLAIEGREA